MHSLGEILDSGRYHTALDGTFRARNRPEKRDTDEYRRALVKRTAVRQLVLAALDEHQVQALGYPTMRQLPATIGEPQRGTNCQLDPAPGRPWSRRRPDFPTAACPWVSNSSERIGLRRRC